MRIVVNVKPGTRNSEVKKNDSHSFSVRVDAPPAEGRANARLVELLAAYFRVPKSMVCIVSGRRSRRKVVSVDAGVAKN
ncbi:MAG: DUF167 domain-containing protein [Candidatus Uhrbacteria bacterium]